ncbi:MAG: hypothetical protein NC084_13250, partial [Bacteroides sp.]|nr:hypothetical protein [Eubacterium sp.]MCM1419309.1 hypothetical protein [Roseburia sp.]MCM1463663.1 hypothetical protein [Bacteroides sp.]
MRELSEKYKELANRAGRYPRLRLELYAGARGAYTDEVEAELSGEDAIISATYTNGITAKPARFETGLAFSGAVELTLSGGEYPALTVGKRFKLFSGFYDHETGETEEAAVGEFFVESVATEGGRTTVKARDKMIYAEQKFKATDMSYPCRLSDCLKEIFRQMGFTLPEGYTLAIDPEVVAPAWTKPNATEGIYLNGYFLVEDYTSSYNIMLPGAEKPTKGYRYLASGFALTCREALASIAKMQLGNCFIDGDGIPRFTGYGSSPPIGDERITQLSIGAEHFKIDSVSYNYRGYDEESTGLFKRKLTEWRGEILYYTNFPSRLPATLAPVSSKVVGKEFFEGTVERKGVGEIEIGDFIDYQGKLGTKRFFTFGLQYEWSGASFNETFYSFAPDYSGVDYEWLNDRDLVADEDQPGAVVEEEVEEVEETPYTAGQGITISADKVIGLKVAGKGSYYDGNWQN